MDMTSVIIIYVVIIGGMYFLLIRPQRREKARIRAMVAEMAVGDTVLTSSGFYGVLIDVQDEDVIVEFGNNKNCRIPMQKTAIVQIEKQTTD
jgi:preprotein translocase subunit YajC